MATINSSSKDNAKGDECEEIYYSEEIESSSSDECEEIDYSESDESTLGSYNDEKTIESTIESIETMEHTRCAEEEHPSTIQSNGKMEEFTGGAKTYIIFAYGGLSLLGFSLLASVAWIVTYARGYGWTRNPAKFALELQEPVEESNEANRHLIDAHAFMGLAFIFLCVYQFASPILFGRHDQKDSLRKLFRSGHRIVGRIIVILSVTTVVTGAVFTITSDRFRHNVDGEEYNIVERIGGSSMFWLGGIGTLVNFAIGLKQVMFVKEKTPSKMLVHKACMFFGFYSVGLTGFSEFVVTIVQLIWSHCSLGHFGALICYFVSYLIQFSAILYALFRYDRALFAQKVVRYNMAFFGVQVFLAFLPIPYFLFLQPPQDESCMGTQN